MNSVEQMTAARHVYRVKNWRRVIYILLGLGLMGGGCFRTHEVMSSNGSESFDVLCVLPIVVGGYLLAAALLCRLTLEGTRIEYRGVIQGDAADLNEIEGYRMVSYSSGTFTALQLKDGRDPILVPTSIARDDYSREWFQKIKKLD